jgi:hypothetical protein
MFVSWIVNTVINIFSRRRERRIEILLPLERSRGKPEPMRPNERRVNKVRAALATAPPEASHRQLIEHVREQTGIGASPKLIVRLTKEGAALLITSALVASSCARPARATQTATTPTPVPTPIKMDDSPAKPADRPRLIKVKLTITSPDDLRVKVGERVDAGAVLSDRAAERERLIEQRYQLALAARRISAQVAAAAESIKLLKELGSTSLPSSFAAEQAAIRRAEVGAEASSRQVEIQRQRLTALPSAVPAGFDAAAVESHEAARLALAEDAQRQAVADVELAKAKLQSAQEVRALEEKRHAVDFSRQLLAARSQIEQAEIARAQLIAQMAALDQQLAQLAAVRAPFGGRVERILWEEQNDQAIAVVLYLAVADSGQH